MGSFFFAILLFTTVAVVIDLTEKINDIISKSVPWSLLFSQYYANFIPFISALLSPLFLFVAVIFFTSRLANQSQIVAVLSSGTSYYRLMRPYIIGSTFLALLLMGFNHFVVPNANKKRLAFEYNYLSTKFKTFSKNVHLQVSKDRYIYMENYSNSDSTGYKFSYEIMRENKLLYKLRADKITWKGDKKKWEMTNYFQRTFDREGEHLKHGAVLDTVLNFKPSDFDKRIALKEEMNSFELMDYIKLLRARGEEQVVWFEIELYRRTAGAAAMIILTIIGYSLASRKVRGGLGMHLVLGFLLSGAYIVFMQFSTTFSTNSNLPPILGVWIPNMVFGVLAAVLVWKAQK